jgi:cysteine desulfurase/selenocysteine lyase
VTLTSASFKSAPGRFEAGSPPIAAAIGLGVALDWVQALDRQAIQAHELQLTRRLLDGLASIPGVRVLGPLDTRDCRGVVAFAVAGFSAEEVCRMLDSLGVALSGGYHCAQPLVRAFGVEGAARASLAPYSLDVDIDALLAGSRSCGRHDRRAGRGRTAGQSAATFDMSLAPPSTLHAVPGRLDFHTAPGLM